jgi:hypothetical protein
MDRIDYLFIFETDGCEPGAHRASIDTPGGDVTVVGVSSVDQACEVARTAREQGTARFIELCGAFGEEGCRRVIDAVDGALPVGYVAYLPEEKPKIDALLP